MRDLPPLQDDDMTDLDSQVHLLKLNARASRPNSPVHKSRIRQALPRPQPQPNDNLTDGKVHSRSSSITQHARIREFLHDASDATPIQGTSVPDVSNRASSPDVASFLATTPRPRRRSETSTSSRSQSQSRRRTHKSLPSSSRASAVGRLSVFSLPDQPTRQGSASLTSQSLLAYAGNADDGDDLWDDSLLEDYGVPAIGNGDGDFANRLDEDDATGDSDSSLDLHTPLPCVPFFSTRSFPQSELTFVLQ
jgi:large subunit ribosomal protein LP1